MVHEPSFFLYMALLSSSEAHVNHPLFVDTSTFPLFDTPGAWPATPWEGRERQGAPWQATHMGHQWPTAPTKKAVFWGADENPYTTPGLWRDSLAVYMVLETFWLAWGHARQHPDERVVWSSDFEVHGPPSDPSPGHPWMAVTAEREDRSSDLTPFGYDAEFLANGMYKLGLNPMAPLFTTGIVLDPEADLRLLLETCLGKAYAQWWHQHQLELTLPTVLPNRSKPRM